MNKFNYDDSGKIVLDDIYNQPTPASYYSELSRLDYCIPERAKPSFEQVIAARRKACGEGKVKLVDVGCSYGVNAALLKHGQSMGDLAEHYQQAERQGLDREALIGLDRDWYSDVEDDATTIVGLDVSDNAIDYAVAAGVLDGGVAADFESSAPDAGQLDVLGDSDLIISTGCYGYITETTIDRLLSASKDSAPWMAHFVLRMFDFESAAESLAKEGYVTRQVGTPVRQRRFASLEERAHVLDNLEARGIDPEGREADGWYFAELHVSCPEAQADGLFGTWDASEVRA